MYSLVAFVPADHTEALMETVFAAGAGRLGNYERCAFTVRGQGRFRPLDGSKPFLGITNRDEVVIEDRVEFVVSDDRVDAVLATLRSAHPYEEPAIYLHKLDPRCIRGSEPAGGC